MVNDNDYAAQPLTNDQIIHIDDEQVLDDQFESATTGEIDLDKIMVSTARYGRPKGLDDDHLYKVSSIDLNTAECTIDISL